MNNSGNSFVLSEYNRLMNKYSGIPSALLPPIPQWQPPILAVPPAPEPPKLEIPPAPAMPIIAPTGIQPPKFRIIPPEQLTKIPYKPISPPIEPIIAPETREAMVSGLGKAVERPELQQTIKAVEFAFSKPYQMVRETMAPIPEEWIADELKAGRKPNNIILKLKALYTPEELLPRPTPKAIESLHKAYPSLRDNPYLSAGIATLLDVGADPIFTAQVVKGGAATIKATGILLNKGIAPVAENIPKLLEITKKLERPAVEMMGGAGARAEAGMAGIPKKPIVGELPVFSKTTSIVKKEQEFQAYKNYVIGKEYISYGGGRDIILDVKRGKIGGFDYTVKDITSGEIRGHSTFIPAKKVRSIEKVLQPVPSEAVTKAPTPAVGEAIPKKPVIPEGIPKEAWQMTKEELSVPSKGKIKFQDAEEIRQEINLYGEPVATITEKDNTFFVSFKDVGVGKGKFFKSELSALNYIKDRAGSRIPLQYFDRDINDFTNKGIVRKALSEGKPVPAEVLADYPDLAQATAVKPAPAIPPIRTELPPAGVKTAEVSITTPEAIGGKIPLPKPPGENLISVIDTKSGERLSVPKNELESGTMGELYYGDRKVRIEHKLLPEPIPTTKVQLKEKWTKAIKSGNTEGAYRLQNEFINRKQPTHKQIDLLAEPPPYYPSVLTDNISPEAFLGAKDRSVFGMVRETMERNIEDVFGKEAKSVQNFISEPIKANETKRIQWLTKKRLDARAEMEKLGIKRGSKDAELVMDYGEGKIQSYDIPEAARGRIIHASNWFRKQYDEILSQWNAERVKFGYDVVPKRADYFRHTQEITSLADRIGIITNSAELPTEISGLTDIFKPGKPFTSAELKRMGGRYLKDPVVSFDNYIDSVGKQIFHTDSMQRVGALETHIRLLGKENIKELPHFVANLSEYGNMLGGKGAKFDRGFEGVFGRGIYELAKWLRSRTSANMIAGNISSASMNTIVWLTQSLATTPKLAWIRGLAEAAISPFMRSIADIGGQQSQFLLRRYLPKKIQYNILDKGVNVANWFFETTDKFTAKAVISGKYYEYIGKGLSPAEAIKEADKWAGRMIADRSLGQLPNIMNIKTLAPITQFQTEINNIYSFLKKDIPLMYQGNARKIIDALAQYVVYSYMFNEISEKTTGRRPILDPIYAVATALGKTRLGQKPSGESKEWYKRIYLASKDIVNNMPFVGGIAGGRFPITAGVPNIGGMVRGEKSVISELSRPLFYTIFPFGGSQVKKTIEGTYQYIKGESKTKGGKTRYGVEQTPMNLGKSVLFGKYAPEEAQEYYQTEQYKYGRPKTRTRYDVWHELMRKHKPTVRSEYDRLMEKYKKAE